MPKAGRGESTPRGSLLLVLVFQCASFVKASFHACRLWFSIKPGACFRFHVLQNRVLPHSMVDNSVFSPMRLTERETLLILASQGSSPCFPFQTARMMMVLHVFVFLLSICLLLTLALLCRLDWFPLRPSSSLGGAKRSRLLRLLKPRSPDDCPACRLACTPSPMVRSASAPVRPWSEVKSRRGAPQYHLDK